MDNTFNFSRLWLLIKKQWFDNAKLYLLSLLAMLGLLTVVFILWASFQGGYRFDEEDTYVIFSIFLFSIGPVFASTTFNALGDKAKATYWLTIPATHLEKLLCGIFYSLIVFTLVYVLGFFIIQRATFFFVQLNPKNEIVWMKKTAEMFKVIFLFFIAIQSLFIVGSVYFERFSFIKTLLAALLISFVFTFTVQFLIHNFFPDGIGMRGLTTVSLYGENETKIYRLAPWIEKVLNLMLQYIWAPVLLVAAYFRLKEKEI